MTIWVNENTRLLCQGITGSTGSFHCGQMMAYGTNLVAGVTPGKGGQTFEGKVPVYNTVAQAVAETEANASVIATTIMVRLESGRRHLPFERSHHARGGDQKRWPICRPTLW